MARNVEDILQRVMTLELLLRGRNGPDLSILDRAELHRYTQFIASVKIDSSGMSEDQFAEAAYTRLCDNDRSLFTKQPDLAEKLYGWLPLPAACTEAVAADAYYRSTER